MEQLASWHTAADIFYKAKTSQHINSITSHIESITHRINHTSHDKGHLELSGLPLIILNAHPLRHNRLLICILLSEVVQHLLELLHLQDVAPVPEIHLQLLHVLHHLQQPLDEVLHLAVELLHLHGEQCGLSVLVVLLHRLHRFVQLRVLLRALLVVLLLQAEQFQHLPVVHLEPQEVSGVLRLIVPRRHFESEPLVVDLHDAGILQQMLETVLQLENVGLASDEAPLTELQTDLLEGDVAELIDKVEHGLELLNSAVVEMGGVEPQTFDVILGVLDDVLTYLFEDPGLRQIEAPQIYFEGFDGFAGSEGPASVAEEVVQNLVLREMAIPETLQLDVRYLRKPRFVDVFFELLELGFAAEEVAAPRVQFGDLSRVEYQCHYDKLIEL